MTPVAMGDHFAWLGMAIRNEDPSLNLPLVVQIFFPDAGYQPKALRRLKDDMAQAAYVKPAHWISYKTKLSAGAGFFADGGGFKKTKGTGLAAFTYLVTISSDLLGQDRKQALSQWDKNVPPYLALLKAPPFPLPLDATKVDEGTKVFQATCARCHGAYVKDASAGGAYRMRDYPQVALSPFAIEGNARPLSSYDPAGARRVPPTEIGTDNRRAKLPDVMAAQMLRLFGPDFYDHTERYVAHPLDGIWARSPYLHNASIPTLRQLLRPALRYQGGYARIGNPTYAGGPMTLDDGYDFIDVGWKTTSLGDESTKTYNPSQPGDGLANVIQTSDGRRVKLDNDFQNTGHEFAAKLSDEQVADLLEFLKTL